ncbi:MAG: hypothetical protein ACKKMS_03045 [Candidatus Nealsonbacteria bacterium]
MFWENFWANLISGITLLFFGHKKKNARLEQESNNKQKNKAGPNIVQNIGTQNIHYHYHNYYIDPKDIPSSKIKDTNITGTTHNINE